MYANREQYSNNAPIIARMLDYLDDEEKSVMEIDSTSSSWDGKEESHPCGWGSRGCIGKHGRRRNPAWLSLYPAKMIRESHPVNVSRNLCHTYVTCPGACRMTFPVRPCPGHGDDPEDENYKCLQVWIVDGKAVNPDDLCCYECPPTVLVSLCEDARPASADDASVLSDPIPVAKEITEEDGQSKWHKGFAIEALREDGELSFSVFFPGKDIQIMDERTLLQAQKDFIGRHFVPDEAEEVEEVAEEGVVDESQADEVALEGEAAVGDAAVGDAAVGDTAVGDVAMRLMALAGEAEGETMDALTGEVGQAYVNEHVTAAADSAVAL